MSTMVERVARAMHEAVLPEVPWEPNGDGYYEAQYISARAAIEAMKPTSFAMDVSGVLHLRERPSDASGCFEAMIDAALKEKA